MSAAAEQPVDVHSRAVGPPGPSPGGSQESPGLQTRPWARLRERRPGPKRATTARVDDEMKTAQQAQHQHRGARNDDSQRGPPRRREDPGRVGSQSAISQSSKGSAEIRACDAEAGAVEISANRHTRDILNQQDLEFDSENQRNQDKDMAWRDKETVSQSPMGERERGKGRGRARRRRKRRERSDTEREEPKSETAIIIKARYQPESARVWPTRGANGENQ